VRRTHGGALLPTAASQEDSFARRLKADTGAKRRLAEVAIADLSADETVFLDSSTTSYFVARAMADRGVAATVLTNSLPIMELVFEEGAQLELIGMGGSLRRITRSFVGPFAVQTIKGHFADRLFLSVKGITEGGTLTDADPLEAEVKRSMIAQAARSTVLVDRSKLSVRGLSLVAEASAVSRIVAHGLSSAEASALNAAGAALQVIDEVPGQTRATPVAATPRS
jgi:DeoR/GlpR family transcriptional regulator of sugar metabolism